MSSGVRGEYLELAETKLFYPQRLGITNLSFKLRIHGLDEYLKASTSLEKINDVHFDILWQAPGKVTIKVVGINEKYKQLIEQLTMQAHQRLLLIFPIPLSSMLRSYKISEVKNANRITIKGLDETYSRDVHAIEVVTDENGKLMESTLNYPSSQKKSTYKTSMKGWSQGKFVVDEISTYTRTASAEAYETVKFDYLVVGGIGLPEKIEIRYHKGLNAEKNKDVAGAKEEIFFGNYKLNSNIRP
ncbi:MAG: hypothetical protein A2X86_05650 [Bdellovibrionales bacterium GWA2_49_15]|nr:MAG: hypothetical protein A2X86_05650 [Bdellovibrionales bacterium GWA2_49_15]